MDSVGKLLLLSRQSMQNAGLTNAWLHGRIIAMTGRTIWRRLIPQSAGNWRLGGEEIGTTLDDASIGKAITAYGKIGSTSITSVTVFTPPALDIQTYGSSRPVPAPEPAEVKAQAAYTFEEIAKDTTLATFESQTS